MAVTSSIVVQFTRTTTEANRASLIAQIDNREASQGGLNNGKSSFTFDDTAYILVYPLNVGAITVAASSGNVVRQGGLTQRSVTETVNFSQGNEANTSYPINSLQGVSWLGNSLGSLTVSGAQNVRSQSSGVGVARITYTTDFFVYAVTPPNVPVGVDEYPVNIVISGVEA